MINKVLFTGRVQELVPVNYAPDDMPSDAAYIEMQVAVDSNGPECIPCVYYKHLSSSGRRALTTIRSDGRPATCYFEGQLATRGGNWVVKIERINLLGVPA